MKKRTLFLCLFMIACMSFSLVSCDNKNTPPVTENPPEINCTTHVDADKNGLCDNCNSTVEVAETPNVTISKVENAANLLNQFISGDMNSIMPETFNLAFSLSNATTTGDMFEELGEIPIESVTINGSTIHIIGKENGTLYNAYLIVTDEGYYGVATDGTNYEYIMENTSNVEYDSLPEITADDITYDESTGYYSLNASYTSNFKPSSETNFDEMLGMDGIDSLLANMKYDVKFKISESNTISELNVKGYDIKNDIRSEYLSVIYTQNENGMRLSMTLNYYVNANFTVTYEVKSETTGTFAMNIKIIPLLSLGINTQTASFSVDVTLSENTNIFIPDDVQTELDKVSTIFKNLSAIEEKYANKTYICNEYECTTIAVYDTEYKIYVLFDNYWDVVYSGCSIDYDDSYTCLGTIVGNTIVVSNHSQDEQVELLAAEKYAGDFTCDGASCETIVVFDESLNRYIVFEEDFFDAGVYEFYYVTDEPWGSYCVGNVNLNTMTLTVTEHSALENILAYVENRQFTAVGYNNCDYVMVYDETSEYYIMFTMYQGKLEYCGYSTSGGNCLGTINFNNNTITITEHNH